VNDPAVLPQLEPLLPLGWEATTSAEVDFLFSFLVGGEDTGKGTRRYHLVYSGASRVARTMEWQEALTQLGLGLQTYSALLAKDYLFVHAGVVGWQGQAIVIPGRSYSGKTTLVKALIEAGATYYSDEYAILDPTGQVHPYPLPLSIRDENGGNVAKLVVESLGGQTGRVLLPVGLIVSTRYEAGANWQPQPLTPAQALLALMDNTVAARQRPEKTMPILKKAVTGAAAVASKRGEARTIVPFLLKAISADPKGGQHGVSKES
jgi:hypothetical protein